MAAIPGAGEGRPGNGRINGSLTPSYSHRFSDAPRTRSEHFEPPACGTLDELMAGDQPAMEVVIAALEKNGLATFAGLDDPVEAVVYAVLLELIEK